MGRSPRTAKPRAAGEPPAPPRRRPRGGRPSRAESERLGAHILDAAAELFFTAGYGATTIEAVAKRARISKRTFYDRFDDKAALFAAVVRRTIARLRPPPDAPIVLGANIEEVLRHLAELILGAALAPDAVALHRLIVAESARFPELAAAVAAEGGPAEAVALIASLLARETHAGRLAVDNTVFAAQQFLHMIIGIPQRRAMGLGAPMTLDEQRAWARAVVALFLDGCRGAAR
jgi:TetR/AcrR family transcriptional repressor of mexJK operon